jgi:hypothetical protein
MISRANLSERMTEDAAVEALIEACVSAGLAALRANEAAIESRYKATEGGTRLTDDDVERLNNLDATASHLTRSFLDAQRSLAHANQVRFKERLDEVTHRIAERLNK